MTSTAMLARSAALATGAVALFAITACEDVPPLKIKYDLSTGPTQKCVAATCDGIDLACASVISIRIEDPQQPETALFSTCRRLTVEHNLCELAKVRLVTEEQLPARRLSIEVAVYHGDDIQDDAAGNPLCPADQPFDANNFAAPSDYRPAIAGRGYYTPGDEETTVKLGCVDLSVVNTPECKGENIVEITASADDFDSGVFLQPPVANNVALSIGTPVESIDGDADSRYILPYSDLTPLSRVPGSVPAAWRTAISPNPSDPKKSMCVVVEEKTPGTTSTAACKEISFADPQLDLRGLRVSKTTLTQVLAAIGEPFPKKGLVLGMVLDGQGKPAAGVQVHPSSGTVQYLGGGRDRLIGGSTSSSGIFISLDTPFQTSWTALGTSGGYGGLIENHVTVVILQPDASQP